MKKTNPDTAATKKLLAYAARYAETRGLKPNFPALNVALGADMNGWPVRNTDNSGTVAHFTTIEAARDAIAKAQCEFRKAHNACHTSSVARGWWGVTYTERTRLKRLRTAVGLRLWNLPLERPRDYTAKGLRKHNARIARRRTRLLTLEARILAALAS